MHIPHQAALEREHGEQLVGMGLVGEALGIFERLELWDNLLVCYQLLDKEIEALALAEERLKVSLADCSTTTVMHSAITLCQFC